MRWASIFLGVLAMLVGLGSGCRGEEPPADDGGVSGARAFEHVRTQVGFGPRPAGSEAAARTRAWLRQELEGLGYAVEEQAFRTDTPRGPLTMVNVLARRPGSRPEALVLAAHYDTKRFDQFEFVGANDGASGVALLLELARVFSGRPLERELVLAFLDGEEAVIRWSATDSLYGSRHLADEWVRTGESRRVRAVIVLDMVGDRDLSITRDLNSHPELQEVVFEEARRLGHLDTFAGAVTAVEDDHIPFRLAGIPATVVIGFATTPQGPRPSYWHTAQDTLDKVAPESLELVGRVVESALRRLDRTLRPLPAETP